jgi:DNA-binding transcriptional LysR family regulator
MELQQIKYFLTLAEELHFWHTAEKLFITQSALSRQIKALEDELGIQLFERTKRNVKLTEAGVFYREQWLRLMEEINRIHRQAKNIHEGTYGNITIGYPGSIAYGYLPQFIADIAHSLPQVKVELVEPTDISFEELLLNYQMDIGFRRDPALNPALQSKHLYSEPFALIVPVDHPLQQHNFQGLQDVKHEKFILSGLHHKTHYVSSLQQIFNNYQLHPDVVIESDFGGIILSLVAQGLGVSILPSSYSFGASKNVRFINLPHTTNLYITWRKDDKSPVLDQIIKHAEQVALQFKQMT